MKFTCLKCKAIISKQTSRVLKQVLKGLLKDGSTFIAVPVIYCVNCKSSTQVSVTK